MQPLTLNEAEIDEVATKIVGVIFDDEAELIDSDVGERIRAGGIPLEEMSAEDQAVLAALTQRELVVISEDGVVRETALGLMEVVRAQVSSLFQDYVSVCEWIDEYGANDNEPAKRPFPFSDAQLKRHAQRAAERARKRMQKPDPCDSSPFIDDDLPF